MGIIICEKHGGTGFVEMCRHIFDELELGNYPEYHELTLWLDLRVCRECWEKFDFARFENHPDLVGKELLEIEEDDPVFIEYEKAYNEVSNRVRCGKCLREADAKIEN